MLFLLLFISCLLIYVHSNSDKDVVVNYFVHKHVASVIGITCYGDSDNRLLISDLNDKNMSATAHKLDTQSSINLSKLVDINYWKLGIFVDTRCYTTDELTLIFNQATEYRMFDELRSWLILGDNLRKLLSIVNDTAFGISTDFAIAVSTDLTKYEFYDLYNIFKERGGELNVTYYGDWQQSSGLTVNLTQPKFQRRANFHSLVLRAMFYKSQHKPDELTVSQYYQAYDDPLFKDWHFALGYLLMSLLSDRHNFTLQVMESDVARGDEIGPLVRALLNNTVDFTGSPVTMTMSRMKLVKFVHQNWNWLFRSCFFFRNPQPNKAKVDQITRPLAGQVWYLMLICISAGVVVLSITQYCHCLHSDKVTLSNSLLIIIGALCQQGTETKIAHFSTRIAFLYVMIFSLLMFNYYSASVVSVRLNEPIFKINNSLNQLGKLDLKMASEYTDIFGFYLKKPDWDSRMFYEHYWKKIPKSKQFMKVNDGMRLVQKGGFAYQSNPEEAYLFIKKYFYHRDTCDLMEVDFFKPFYPTYAVAFNSTFVEIARVGFMKIAESGLRKRRLNTLQNIKPVCRTDILTASGVTIDEFAPHLFILSTGVMTAVFIYVLEIVIAKRCHICSLKNSKV